MSTFLDKVHFIPAFGSLFAHRVLELCPRTVRLPDNNDLPDITVVDAHKHLAAFLASLQVPEKFYNFSSLDFFMCGKEVIQIS